MKVELIGESLEGKTFAQGVRYMVTIEKISGELTRTELAFNAGPENGDLSQALRKVFGENLPFHGTLTAHLSHGGVARTVIAYQVDRDSEAPRLTKS